MVQLSFAPMALPATGMAQVPRPTLAAEPHDSGATA